MARSKGDIYIYIYIYILQNQTRYIFYIHTCCSSDTSSSHNLFQLPFANFIIGDFVAGTIPVTIQKGFLSRPCRYKDEVRTDPSRRTYSTDDIASSTRNFFFAPSPPLGAPRSPAPSHKTLILVNLPHNYYNFFLIKHISLIKI